MYVQRLRQYIGADVLELGGLDALILTDDIGIHNPHARQLECQNMDWFGLGVDPQRNAAATDERLTEPRRTCWLLVVD
jgi:acetate kinase